MARISYAGAAAKTSLGGSMSATVPTAGGTFGVADGSGYPDGSLGAFVVEIGRGTGAEEKILCSSRSGATFTVAAGGRGYDGTAAAAHSAGDSVEAVIDALSLLDLQRHVYDTTHDDHPQYNLDSLFDAYTILKADADNTPVPLTVPPSTFVGRLASGGIVAGTMAQLRAILGSGTPGAGNFLRGDGAWTAGALANLLSATVITSQTTASTSFTDLATVGPQVTLTTGTAALVVVTATISSGSATDTARMGFAVSGATTIAAAAASSLQVVTNPSWTVSAMFPVTLTAGSNTFTAKYSVSGGTGSFSNRTIAVLAVG